MQMDLGKRMGLDAGVVEWLSGWVAEWVMWWSWAFKYSLYSCSFG